MSVMCRWFLKKLPTDDNVVEFCLEVLRRLGFLSTATGPRRGWALAHHVWNHFVVLVCASIVFILAPVTLYLRWGLDLMLTVEPVGAIFGYGVIVVHAGSFLFGGQRFQRMVDALETMKELGWRHRERPKEVVDAGRRLARLGRGYYAVFWPVVTLLAAVVLPISATRRRDMSFRLWFPYDHKAFPHFELTIYPLLVIIGYGYYLVLVDCTLLLALLAQAAFQLALLGHNIGRLVTKDPSEPECQLQQPKTLERGEEKGQHVAAAFGKLVTEQQVPVIGERKTLHRLDEGNAGEQEASVTMVGEFSQAVANQSKELVQKKAERRLKQCVQHHQAITSFIGAIQSALAPILLYHWTVVIFSCVLGSVAILHAGEAIGSKLYLICAIVAGALGQQALICFVAERVIEESEGVRDAVFGCDWFDQSESFKRSMRVIMSRSNQPLVINPLGLPLTLETFHGVLKLAYSYYMSLTSTI